MQQAVNRRKPILHLLQNIPMTGCIFRLPTLYKARGRRPFLRTYDAAPQSCPPCRLPHSFHHRCMRPHHRHRRSDDVQRDVRLPVSAYFHHHQRSNYKAKNLRLNVSPCRAYVFFFVLFSEDFSVAVGLQHASSVLPPPALGSFVRSFDLENTGHGSTVCDFEGTECRYFV